MTKNVVIAVSFASYSAALTVRVGLALAATAAGLFRLGCGCGFFGLAAGVAAALPEAVLRPAARRPFGELPHHGRGACIEQHHCFVERHGVGRLVGRSAWR